MLQVALPVDFDPESPDSKDYSVVRAFPRGDGTADIVQVDVAVYYPLGYRSYGELGYEDHVIAAYGDPHHDGREDYDPADNWEDDERPAGIPFPDDASPADLLALYAKLIGATADSPLDAAVADRLGVDAVTAAKLTAAIAPLWGALDDLGWADSYGSVESLRRIPDALSAAAGRG